MKAIATVGERLQLIKDWQLSGLTISEWCRRNGIHKNTFSNWIHRFRKQGLLETPAVIPEPIIRDPVSQDIVKIEVARNSGSAASGVSASDNHGYRHANSSHIMVVRSKYCACEERGYHESNSNCWRTTSADQGLAA